MCREKYRGYTIEARRSELQNQHGWSAYVLIEKDDNAAVTVTEYTISGRFKTEEEAIEAGLAQGRVVINKQLLS